MHQEGWHGARLGSCTTLSLFASQKHPRFQQLVTSSPAKRAVHLGPDGSTSPILWSEKGKAMGWLPAPASREASREREWWSPATVATLPQVWQLSTACLGPATRIRRICCLPYLPIPERKKIESIGHSVMSDSSQPHGL